MNMESPRKKPVPEAANENKEWGMSGAIAEVGILEQQVMQEGAVDTEPNQFALIRSAVINSKITPSEGVQKAFDLVHKHRQGEPENPESNQ